MVLPVFIFSLPPAGVSLFSLLPGESLVASHYANGSWAVGIVGAVLLGNLVFILYYENIYGAYLRDAFYFEMAIRFLGVLQVVILILSIGLSRACGFGKLGALCLLLFYVYILPKCCYNIAAWQEPGTFALNVLSLLVLFLFAWKDLTGISLFLGFFSLAESLVRQDSSFGRFLRWVIDNPDKASAFLSILAGGSGGISLWTVITGIIDLFHKDPEPEPELLLLRDARRRYGRGRSGKGRGRSGGSGRHMRITKHSLGI